MLQVINKPTTDPAPRPRLVHRHADITVVEARRKPADVRADLAARFLAGQLTLAPTATLAKYVFRISIPKIKSALKQLDVPVMESDLDIAWNNATSDARASFLRKHAGQLWRVLDHLTTP